MKLLTVLNVTVGSDRFPGKMLADVEGRPLVTHVIERLKQLPGTLILACTKRSEDMVLCEVARQAGIPFVRAMTVLTQINDAVGEYGQDADFVFRALGDCPFLATELVAHAVKVMTRQKAEAFLWALPPSSWPVYGAREFPYSRKGWSKIANNARMDEREHTDLYFHRNRGQFKIAYHDAPMQTYFRDYRLEVDWPEDLELIRKVARGPGMLAPMRDVIGFLDANPRVAMLNRERVAITGPRVSYDFDKRREWVKEMRGRPIIAWDGSVWEPPDERAQPVFCSSGSCVVGFGWEGALYLPADGGTVTGRARLSCRCGAGRVWKSRP